MTPLSSRYTFWMSYENIFQSFQGLYVSKKKWVLIIIIGKTPPPKRRKKKNFPYLPACRTSPSSCPRLESEAHNGLCFLCRPGQGQGMLTLMPGGWEGHSWVGLKEKLELLVAWMLILTAPSITQHGVTLVSIILLIFLHTDSSY